MLKSILKSIHTFLKIKINIYFKILYFYFFKLEFYFFT